MAKLIKISELSKQLNLIDLLQKNLKIHVLRFWEKNLSK